MEKQPLTETLEKLDTNTLLVLVQRNLAKLAIDGKYPELNSIAGEAKDIIEMVRGRVNGTHQHTEE